jgi:hypothetical protein
MYYFYLAQNWPYCWVEVFALAWMKELWLWYKVSKSIEMRDMSFPTKVWKGLRPTQIQRKGIRELDSSVQTSLLVTSPGNRSTRAD